jgi:hypothetical protein
MFIMAANCAGIVGGQLFRSDDLPYYHRGWTIAVAFMAFSLFLVIVLLGLYAYSNSQIERSSQAAVSDGRPNEKNGSSRTAGDGESELTRGPLLYNF